ncbi:hypothetical protein EVAR_51352_1 [Eumeta japonica]|uniref:Uncharacterized protein n=1 Tax=Eumeta variegata TaxID=151549 RepID=A0A4C1XX21_EUMVA|nr:hypothetical protein EVAR_51352_1 [Eumeta japonica]
MPAVVKSRVVETGHSTHTANVDPLQRTSTHTALTRRPVSTLRSRPAPMQFTSPHPAPDWPARCAARANDDLALQRAAYPAPRAHRVPPCPLAPRRAPRKPESGPTARRAAPHRIARLTTARRFVLRQATSGESQW